MLRDLAALTARHMENPRVPGSMRALGKIVVDVNAAAEESTSTSTPPPTQQHHLPPSSEVLPATPAPSLPYSPRVGTPSSSSIHNLLAFPVDMHGQGQYGGGLGRAPQQVFDPQIWTQLSFMDEPGGNSWQDWTWDDIETIVRR